jgi:TfoX/Sxy family transcriptional regulator of competence genes
MAHNLELADLLRATLTTQQLVEEKAMMGGICFMVDGKMCLGVANDDLMLRLDPEIYEIALNQPNIREMDFTKRPMRGYVYLEEKGWRDPEQLQYWVDLALEFTPRAKSSKKAK